ncbi:MAG: glycosyltransferase family 4 protein [Chloroflexaceae bacterium]|nr:glycosyltransferase family 4 protein [Chloroflexaceae bacterium]
MRLLYAIPRYGPQFMSNETHGEVVRELLRLGLEVDVLSFTTRDHAGGPGGWGSGFGNERVYRHIQNATMLERLSTPLARYGLHYEYFGSMLAGYLALTRQQSYDLIHLEGTFPLGAIAALAHPHIQRPYVITTTGGDLFRLPGQGYGYGHHLLPRTLMRLALRYAAWVRTNSRLSARLCLGYGANPQRITPLPVSIANAGYPPADQPLAAYRATCRQQVSAQFGWSDTTMPTLVCVGRLISVKAPELVIAALPAIIKAIGPVRLCIIGPARVDPLKGDYLAFLQQRAAELAVSPFCTFTGLIPPTEIKTYLAAADLLVVPSLIEGLNRVVMEAGAVGTPTVISDGAGAAELVAIYGCGLMTPAGNIAALAHAITRMLTTPQALAQCGERALHLADDCSAAGIARGLVAIYQHALNR